MALYIGSQKVKPSGIGKIYVGSTLIYESTPTVMPVKGDIINIDILGDGTPIKFRVLSISNTTAMLWAYGIAKRGAAANSTTADSRVQFDNGESYQPYAGSLMDIDLNETWYNTLSSTAKAAIVPHTKIQAAYAMAASGEDYTVTTANRNKLRRVSQVTVGTRNVSSLSIDDILDYFNLSKASNAAQTISNNDIRSLMANSTEYINQQWWLFDARTDTNNKNVWLYNQQQPQFYTVNSTDQWYWRNPKSQIDLSKIAFTIDE